MDRKFKGSGNNDKEGNSESSAASSKLGPPNVNQMKQPTGEQKVNGHTRAVKSEGSPGSWQKISKGKKKAPSSEFKNSSNGQPQREKQPTKDSERKGG
jgi:hypothetical protein